MGLNIGAITRDVSFTSATQPSVNGISTTRFQRGTAVSTQSQDGSNPLQGPVFNRNQPELRAGFGANTLSPPGAALQTLNRGVEAVRQHTPTLQQQQEELRSRYAKLRTQFETKAPPPPRRLDLVSPRAQAVQRTGQFVSSLNEAANTAQARVRGVQPTSTQPGPQITINNQTFPLTQNTTPPQVIDLRA